MKMFYKSTRDSSVNATSAQAISQGISTDGGLFVPSFVPKISLEEIKELGSKNYAERAFFIFSKFLTDFSDVEIKFCVENAYNDKKFETENIAEISHLFDGTYMLELWHGPTCAFKDMALQILPYLLTTSIKKLKNDKKIVILVATSGDTGKAALEGFKDVDGTQILVFYPVEGVSDIQKLQMASQEGENLAVCAIKGNFDDAQTGVKQIFTNDEIKSELAEKNMMFSSANSINWGRLAPQIIYYISAYSTLVENNEIALGDKINIAVPTGNFGNILAAFYAKQMGLPVNKLICASNANNILTDFINTGIYDRNREFHTTISPSMDIIISSNLERLLYHLCGENDEQIKTWFNALSDCGKYEVSDAVKTEISNNFYAGFCDDTQTKALIKDVFNKYSYTCDTHTAVAVKVYNDYKKATGDTTKTIIASTANPYKFADSVLEALTGEIYDNCDAFEVAQKLESITKMPIPASLTELKGKKIRFSKIADKSEMKEFLFENIGL